jgi:hypothetical protein
MFLAVSSNDTQLENFIETTIKQVTSYKVLDSKNHRLLRLNFFSAEKLITISDNINKNYTLQKPFHYSDLMKIIYEIQHNYYEIIGDLTYYVSSGNIKYNNKSIWLSETQNTIMSSLVCYKEGIYKKDLYLDIWPRDKEIFENKLDTHLTNLRNLIFDFSEYYLNFKTSKGKIKLDVN